MAKQYIPSPDINTNTTLPQAPDWFDAPRIALYTKLGNQVCSMRIFEESDTTAFCMLIDNLVIYDQSAETVIKDGMTTKGREDTTVRHPAVIMKNTCWSIIQPLLVQFGLTPSARKAMGVGKEAGSILDKYMSTKDVE